MTKINKTLNNLWIPNTVFEDFEISHYYESGIKSEGTVGPIGGSAISQNKILAIKKAISESLDRRSSMIGHNKTQRVPVMDIITGKTSLEPLMKFSLKNTAQTVIDTTGTSAHYNEELAIQYAIQELFQKNSLFLIWYKKRGHILNASELVLPYDKDKKSSTYFIVNKDFFPFFNVLVVQIDESGKSFFGMGTSKEEKNAALKAYEELKLLQYENAGYWGIYQKQIRFNDYSMGNDSQKSYVLELIKNLSEDDKLNCVNTNSFWEIPSFVKSLKIAVLPNNMHPYIHVIKCKSDQLLTHLPLKDLLLKLNDFNKLPINTKRFEITEKPSCPNL